MREIVDLYGEMLGDVILSIAIVGLFFYVFWESEWVQQIVQNVMMAAC